MILTLDQTHKEHIETLNRFDAEVCAEFCRLASTCLLSGDLSSNEKLYRKAASRLRVEVAEVRHPIEALIGLFKLAGSKCLTRQHFQDSLVLTQLPQTLVDTLVESYAEIQLILAQKLRQIAALPLSYNRLEWRLGAVVAGRTIRSCMKPLVTLSFTLVDCNGVGRKVMVECSVDNLRKMREVLEEALLIAKSQKVRKLAKMLT